MKVDSKDLAEGKAWVTSSGILFKDRHYSCRLALIQQWYTRAKTAGSWSVTVLYDPKNAQPDSIYISTSPEYSEDCLCYAILHPDTQDSEQIEQYHHRLQQMIFERAKQQK